MGKIVLVLVKHVLQNIHTFKYYCVYLYLPLLLQIKSVAIVGTELKYWKYNMG